MHQAFADNGLELRPEIEVNLLSSALAFAAQGLGVTVLPRYLARSLSPGLEVAALTAPTVWRSLSAARRPGQRLSPASLAFVDLVREMLAPTLPPPVEPDVADRV
jgi:DNA-binding transcriptional LysR family regulator